MGAAGSGNWYRWNRKTTVEESLTLDISGFWGRLVQNYRGTVTWTGTSGSRSSIGYVVTWGDAPTVTLDYRWRDSEDVRIPVRLQSTPMQFGGRRWWFTCPLIVGRNVCDRRVGMLYLPPGARYFGCRTCHRLTYRSCQEAHREERMFAKVAAELGCDPGLVPLLAERISRSY